MKIIVFTVTNDLTYDQRMHRICNALHNAGYQVILVGRLRTDSVPIRNEPYRQYRIKCFFQKGKFFYLEINLRLFFYLLFQKVEIIGSIDLDTLLPCYLISNIKKCKIVFDAHEHFTEVI